MPAHDEPAESPTLAVAVPNWRSRGEIPLGPRTLRVVRVRDEDSSKLAGPLLPYQSF